MTNATASNARLAKWALEVRSDADKIRRHLLRKKRSSHEYVVTRDGRALRVHYFSDGIPSATPCLITEAARWKKESATTFVANFGAENEGEWCAEHWRDVATRELEALEDVIRLLESHIA